MEGVFLAGDTPTPLRSPPGRDVGLQADDRQDSGRFGLAEQLDGAVEVAVIGQGHRGHPQRLDALDQVRDLAGAVKQAVMAVAVKMHERRAGHRVVTRGLAAGTPLANCGGPGSIPTSLSRTAFLYQRPHDRRVQSTIIEPTRRRSTSAISAGSARPRVDRQEVARRHARTFPLPCQARRGEGLFPLTPGEGRGEDSFPTRMHPTMNQFRDALRDADQRVLPLVDLGRAAGRFEALDERTKLQGEQTVFGTGVGTDFQEVFGADQNRLGLAMDREDESTPGFSSVSSTLGRSR